MGIIKRAFLYVIRKRGKSILLFFVLLIMATFVLTGLSIEKAAEQEQKNLRKTMGGAFELSPVFAESNPYFKVINDGEGGFELYTECPLTKALIDLVLAEDGIVSCDADTQSNVQTDLKIFEGNVPLKGNLNKSVYARTVYSTESNIFFTSETFRLIEGKHISNDEENSAVISKDLAEKNALKIGDSITLKTDCTVDVKVIGIFEILKPDSAFENIATYEKAENQIFIDYNTLQELFPNTPVGFLSAKFSVSDPAELEKTAENVKSISDIDWRAFELSTDNNEYTKAAAPLENLQSLVTLIILVIALVSAVVLALILTMWGRTRIHETGVLLSLGIKKINIMGQYLTEVLMIAAIAFGMSFFSSNAIASRLANEMIESPQNTEDVVWQVKDGNGLDLDDVQVTIKDDTKIDGASSNSEVTPNASDIDIDNDNSKINVSVDIIDMLRLYLIGFAIIAVSVVVSSGTTMRLKPREILSKMS